MVMYVGGDCKSLFLVMDPHYEGLIEATGFKMRYIHEGLVCNGQDMLTFALTHNASKNAQLIARRINASPSVLTAKR